MFRSFQYILIAIILTASVTVFAQSKLPNIGIQKGLALGIVKSVGEKKIVIETKDGMLDVIVLKITGFKRLPPDKLNLKAATDSTLSEISVGDRVLVTGKVSLDKTNIITKTVYLVKNSDLQAIQNKELQEWKTRGISGRVVGVDAPAKLITVEVRSPTGTSAKLKVSPKQDVKYLRYASNSVKYSDAITSDFSTIKIGDMLRALGDRSVDRTSFKAERILTGAFVTAAGTVKAINVEKNEVTISDFKTKKNIVIVVNDASVLKRFPERVAQRLAMRQMMARSGGGGFRPPGSKKTQTKKSGNKVVQRQGQGRGAGSRSAGGRRRGGRAGGNINEMLKRFPTIKVADLKVGDMIAASSPKGKDPSRLIAIKLLAGVEPFLKMPQMSGRRSRGGRRGGGGGNVSIPGLDEGIPNQ